MKNLDKLKEEADNAWKLVAELEVYAAGLSREWALAAMETYRKAECEDV